MLPVTPGGWRTGAPGEYSVALGRARGPIVSNGVDVAVDSKRTHVSRTGFALTAMIPCFNEEACIERAYLEIRREMQAFPDYELLFVDDGSTDRTLAAIKSFA